MNDTYYLDENKQAVPCDLLTWGKQVEEMRQNNSKHIGHDEINGNTISTVWLGLNHQFLEGPPLLFETMVFFGKSFDEIYCDRYSTWDQAVEGHKKAIEWVKNGCIDSD